MLNLTKGGNVPIEDASTIDIVTEPSPGKVCLVITDAGITTDERERMECFVTKLRTYVGYVMSPQFQNKYPDITPKDVSISVVCRIPPTQQMAAVTQVAPHGDKENLIQVEFSIIPGTDAPAPAETETTSEKRGEPESRRPWWKVW